MGRNPGACKVGAKGTKRVLIKQDADGSEPWNLKLGDHCDLDQRTGEGESLPRLGSMERGEEWERENLDTFFFF